MWLQLPPHQAPREPVPVGIGAARAGGRRVRRSRWSRSPRTISMLEPVLSLYLQHARRRTRRAIGLVFGIGRRRITTSLHPICGRLADRFGARRMTLLGLMANGVQVPVLGQAWSFESALGFYLFAAAAVAFVITPSLAYMAEATNDAGVRSFGVAYGLYNLAWGVGLLGGPALGGFLFERMGFARLLLAWAPAVVARHDRARKSKIVRLHPRRRRHDSTDFGPRWPYCCLSSRLRPQSARDVRSEEKSKSSSPACSAGW